ncbi:HAD family phosphatase [Mycolicibacterium sp. P9-22]|uniref:HAD family hydrolase n=1 Tax=Mycolicibacterium sp. P9-22 TaxID=2024613 RepID=UPI0011F00121|nr:HAD family phosphatase [Mycolicibacterium sp. P9-22]KAA0112737.1 HAD family phosphatase [Mycolicibacterium sp. P9-22]
MRAVLWDMDGTLVDSEKLWDIGLQELYRRHGRELSDEVRATTIGGSSEVVMQIVYADLGLDPDPGDIARTADWLHDYVGELFETGLPWCAGAHEMLDELAVAGVTMALVTNTRRALTEKALNSIGRHYFTVTVCGDEVPEGKPSPDPYLRAAALLGLEPEQCLAIEDSVTGTTAAEAAGCAVLVIPNEIDVPAGPRRRHAESLAELSVAQFRAVHADLGTELGERTA